MNFTPSECIVVAMSRQIRGGETLALGLGTALPICAVLLAAHTHAPDVTLFVPATGHFCMTLPHTSMTLLDLLCAHNSLRKAEMAEVLSELGSHATSFYRPAQIDSLGNFNATVIGAYESPSVRLSGAAGLPDLMAVLPSMFFYVPRHTTLTFVERLDFVSGLGHVEGRDPAARRRLGLCGSGPETVVSDLGVFDFNDTGRMRVRSLHANVRKQDVCAATGFELDWPLVVPRTPPPDAHELAVLRKQVDPLGMRELEMMAARERTEKIRAIFDGESALLHKLSNQPGTAS